MYFTSHVKIRGDRHNYIRRHVRIQIYFSLSHAASKTFCAIMCANYRRFHRTVRIVLIATSLRWRRSHLCNINCIPTVESWRQSSPFRLIEFHGNVYICDINIIPTDTLNLLFGKYCVAEGIDWEKSDIHPFVIK